MRGKSNMENRKNTRPTKIHSQQDPWAGSMDPDWIWSCCCSSRPIIGMDEHWTTLTRAAPVGGARLAIRRASFAISDCWQSPQLRDGLDHTPVLRRCSNISQNGPCTEHTRLCCSSRNLGRSRLSASHSCVPENWYLSQI